MEQQFQIGNLRIIQDESNFGVSHLITIDDTPAWEVIATFKYGPDAVIYFANYMAELLEKKKYAKIVNTDKE